MAVATVPAVAAVVVVPTAAAAGRRARGPTLARREPKVTTEGTVVDRTDGAARAAQLVRPGLVSAESRVVAGILIAVCNRCATCRVSHRMAVRPSWKLWTEWHGGICSISGRVVAVLGVRRVSR